MEQLSSRVKPLLLQCQVAVKRHPRRLAAGLTLVLGGFAVTAFGIAPLAPDAALLPQRIVTEALQVPGLAGQLEQLAALDLRLSRHELSRAGDTADSLLARLGVHDPAAAAFIRQDRDARRLVDGRAHKMVEASLGADGTLLELKARFAALDSSRSSTHFTRLTITRAEGRFVASVESAPLVPQVRLGSGTIRSSLWAATDEARLPDSVASQLIDIFSGDIDFHRELRKGDSFNVMFETMTADDQPIAWSDGAGRVLAAEFVNNRRTHQALWFQDAKGKGSYFAFDGRSRRRAFLASPLPFSRVTSGFAMRMHPILQTLRAHNGVDYGAPKGTPVQTIGDGLVVAAGRQSGFGNLVQIQHGGGKSTVYAHLSRIDVRPGQRVEQGQRIGAVGATGLATGPHLHFEFRVNGVFQDPLKMARAAETESTTLEAAQRQQFTQRVAMAQRSLAAAETVGGFRNDAE